MVSMDSNPRATDRAGRWRVLRHTRATAARCDAHCGSRRCGYTRLAVEQVYAGPDLAPAVWVRSGQRQPLLSVVRVASSLDADLMDGQRYVIGATRKFDTSACSVADLGADDQRPDVASGPPRAPRADGLTGADPPLSVAAATGLAGAAVVSACLALWGLSRLRLRRRAHRDQI